MTRVLSFLSLLATGFAVGYIAIAWVSARGPLPVPLVTVRPLQPSTAIPTFAEAAERVQREPAPNQTLQSDNDPGRDALRLDAMQAANAFKQSPCDRTMRENLIKALMAYAKAWAEKSGCGTFGCGGSARVELAAQMFSTPLDLRVREAVHEAFAEGGITVDDFPRNLHLTVAMIAQDRGNPSSCQTANARQGK
jgi:hypothetical protein